MAYQDSRTLVRRLALPGKTLAVLAALLALVVLLTYVAVQRNVGAATAPERDVTISAQDFQFTGVEPRRELKVGERIRLTVVNHEPGIAHDFVISGLKVRTGYLPPGASQTLVFTPTKPGLFRYGCTLHPGLMDGQLIVQRR